MSNLEKNEMDVQKIELTPEEKLKSWGFRPVYDEREEPLMLDDTHYEGKEGFALVDRAQYEAMRAEIERQKEISASLLRELQHLVRLMEPQEDEGGLGVPGIATLNGARLAIAKAGA